MTVIIRREFVHSIVYVGLARAQWHEMYVLLLEHVVKFY